MRSRHRFGLTILDEHLGGGLLPGTLTVIAGATGIGKTQLALRWAHEGLRDQGRAGVICDLTSRGDSQHHRDYASRQFGWDIPTHPRESPLDLQAIWDMERPLGEYYHPFARSGRRVTRGDLEPDDWHAWKSDLARVLRHSAGFLYGHFVRGVRRVVVDGVEPADRFGDSIQFEFFEYLYNHILRLEDQWAARELLREHYRAQEPKVLAHPYDHRDIGCLFVYTTQHVLLDELMSQPIGEGDVFANASTIILLGKVKQENRMGRALYVAKHRGSACSDEILPFRITDSGFLFQGDS